MTTLVRGDAGSIIQQERGLTVKACLSRPSIHSLIIQNGIPRADVAMIIDLNLEVLCQTLNITNSLTEYQKKDIVMTIMDRFKHESVEDIILCFRMAKDGEFGILYNRLDRTIVLDWMTRYLDVKAMEREAENSSNISEEGTVQKGYRGKEDVESIKDWYFNGLMAQKDIEELRKQHKSAPLRQEIDDYDYQEYKKKYLAGRRVDKYVSGASDADLQIPDQGGSGDNESIRRDRPEQGEQDSSVLP